MHIGHLRTYVPADVFVRLLKKMRVNVNFICGSDTHGTPVLTAAEAAGVSPKELYTKYHKHYEETFPKLGIEFDNFGTTDDPENVERTIQIAKELQKNGYIYPKELETPFCDKCNRSLPDRFVRGECPHCGKDARGDECDQGCGRYRGGGNADGNHRRGALAGQGPGGCQGRSFRDAGGEGTQDTHSPECGR